MTFFKNETAETVYKRTYSRDLPNGEKEIWPQTVQRVVDGNLALVDPEHIEPGERKKLIDLIENFKLMPAGRHLKSSGVNDFALNNCWTSGWVPERPEEHFSFTLLRLAEGGGVGANYSDRYLMQMPYVQLSPTVHIVCAPDHPDFLDLVEAGLISTEYAHTWAGAYAVQDSREGWAEALGDLISTAHKGAAHENRVYDVSRVRESGAPLRKFGGTASGPLPFARMLKNVGKILSEVGTMFRLDGLSAMAIDHEIAQCIVSGGVRRSARMSIMHWRDPQIFEFLACKQDAGAFWTTNISVEIDQDFIDQLPEIDSASYPILRAIALGMLTNGEPGIWNSSLSAEGEPGGIYATNPCGEITLNPWEPCCLGHVNLGEFVHDGQLLLGELYEAHRLMTRYLIRATHAQVADGKSADIITRNRRIGVGHLGFADMLAKLSVDYRDAPDDPWVRSYLEQLRGVVEDTAIDYAHWLRIPVPVKLTTVAPTGSISKLCGVSGEGIHAPYARYFLRRIRFSDVDATERAQVEEYRAKGFHTEPCRYAANTTVVEIPTRDPLCDEVSREELVVSQQQLSVADMLAVQEMYQSCYADNAVSYTASVDPEETDEDELVAVLTDYLSLLKGTTAFPSLTRPQSPYEPMIKDQYEAYEATTTESGFDEACATGACPV